MAGGDPVLDASGDLLAAGAAWLAPYSIPGDGLVVGEGNPGVLIFYEIASAPGPLLVARNGDTIVLSGW